MKRRDLSPGKGGTPEEETGKKKNADTFNRSHGRPNRPARPGRKAQTSLRRLRVLDRTLLKVPSSAAHRPRRRHAPGRKSQPDRNDLQAPALPARRRPQNRRRRKKP